MDGLTAIMVVLLGLTIGDFVSYKTNATLSTLFVTAVIFMISFWVGLPPTLFQDSGLLAMGSLTLPILLVNMGSMISMDELLKQWKTVLIALAAVVGIGIVVFFAGTPLFGKQMAASAAPPISGGVVAALIMSEAALAKGLDKVAVFVTLLLVTQTFFGTPVASFCLKKEAKRVLAMNGNLASGNDAEKIVDKVEKKRLIPPLKKEMQTNFTLIFKLSVVALLGVKVSDLTNGAVNSMVVCLIFGIIAREIGLIDEDSLTTANSQGFIMLCVMAVIFGNLSTATPEMLKSLIVPLISCLLLGVAGFTVFSTIAGKFLGEDKYMAIAIGATALFGFPGTYIISNEVATATAKNEEEKKIILDEILPKMLIAGFVTVSIASVFLAGFMVKLI